MNVDLTCFVINGYHDVIILNFLYRSEFVKFPDMLVLDVTLRVQRFIK
jgi:hypothetical protein